LRHKLLMKVFAACSVVMVAALAFGFMALSNSRAASVSPTIAKSKPLFIHFSHQFSDSALATTGLRHWTSSFTYKGQKYTYSMVGTSPAAGSKTTTIPVTIIPLKLTFSNGTVFDGSTKVSNTTGSPLFQNAPFSSGTTQYGDAIQRAEFWKTVSAKSPNYHVVLGTPTIASTISMSIPASHGATAKDSSGKTIGIIDINWFDPQLQTLLSSYSPTMLPIFLSYNVYLSSGAPSLSNCCIGGYHNAVTNSKGLQTYIWTVNADQGVQGGFGDDVGALSHELAEWYNDPFTNNVVPNWQSPIAPQYGCNNLLEVGDPLVGVNFSVSGFSGYHLQDEAFFSWFARQTPSIGINGLYTYLGTFSKPPAVC